MIIKNKKLFIGLIVIAVLITGFFYFQNQVYYSRGSLKKPINFKIERGESALKIGERLKKEKAISSKICFAYYLWRKNIYGKIIAGEYAVNPQNTIPEIALIITQQKEIVSNEKKITFPEGWDSRKMEARIKKQKLSGDNFLDLVERPNYFRDEYDYGFLAGIPEDKSLEGYLFPDTYFFSMDANAEDIIKKMLDNFDRKLSDDLRSEIQNQNKTIYEIITLASILEKEVKTPDDKKIVSGIFWNRIKIGQSLQSCATLSYILRENKDQYSYEDTQIKSPYNTYLNPGLPPGPISNPGIISIKAAIYPVETNYNYFLSNPETGETIFSKTLEEHNANKVKYGL
ncbi:endolytic transglycosylase MltG [bacterium]|nr:endolytic transglycosylase MltG [bacterium]